MSNESLEETLNRLRKAQAIARKLREARADISTDIVRSLSEEQWMMATRAAGYKHKPSTRTRVIIIALLEATKKSTVKGIRKQ